MKSIKPGRGPSGMAFVGSIVAVVFGILWTVMASSVANFGRDSFNNFGDGFSISGPPDILGTIFPLFGVLFVIVGIVNAVYNYKNARGRDRFSIIDIVDKNEEGDQADAWIKQETVRDDSNREAPPHPSGKFCTECGQRLEGNFAFCPGCGKDLSKS